MHPHYTYRTKEKGEVEFGRLPKIHIERTRLRITEANDKISTEVGEKKLAEFFCLQVKTRLEGWEKLPHA